MKALFRILLWTLCFLLLLLAVDQVATRMPEMGRGLGDLRRFYLDVRGRALGLLVPAGQKAPAGFVYVDEDGDLQFADTLEEVPPRYRKDARPLEP